MAVEIFQNQELNDLVFEIEALDEWKEIASELGMEKQLEIIKGKGSPNPFPYMNRGIELIFRTLCPERAEMTKYNKTPIPLPVMKTLAFAIRDKHFKEIEIWYDDKTPDPVAVGYTYDLYAYDKGYNHLKDENGKKVYFDSPEQAKEYCAAIGFELYSTNRENENKYVIARWGDELRPLNELKELAHERLVEIYGAKIKKELEEKQQALKLLKENVTLYLNGELTETQLKGDRW